MILLRIIGLFLVYIAFLLIVAGFSFFFTNYKKTTIFLLVALFAVALILYNNINVVKEIYGIIPSGQ